MKVQIEKIPEIFNTSDKNYEMYQIIQEALKANTFDELREGLKDYEFYYFIYGFGSNHFWVKETNWRNGKVEPNNGRLLFVTK